MLMKKVLKKLSLALLSVLFVACAAIALFGMPANTMTVYAAESDYRVEQLTIVHSNQYPELFDRTNKTVKEQTDNNVLWKYSHMPTSDNTRVFEMASGAKFTATRQTDAKYLTKIDSFSFDRSANSWTGNLTLTIKVGDTVVYTKTGSDRYFVVAGTTIGELSGKITVEVSSTSSSTWYFQWTYAEFRSYVYKAVPSTLNDNDGEGGQGTVNLTYGETMPDLTQLPTRAGYAFKGYYIGTKQYYKADGTPALSSFDVKSDSITLTADWELMEFDVTLDDNGGSGGQGTVTATSTMAMPNLTQVPTRTGYTFLGYYDAKSGGKQYFDEDGNGVGTYDLTKATTVYARWEALKYTASFDSTPGTGGLTSAEFTYDSTLPDLTNGQFPTRESSGGHSYSFGGYYTVAPTDNADGSQTPNGKQYYNDLGKGVGLWKEANDTTVLYAYWTIDMSVTSNGYEGTWDGQNHGITINVASPDDTTIYYGNSASTCNNTNANDFLKSAAGEHTIYFEVRKDGYTTYRHSETIVINKAESVVSLVPTAKTGLEFTNEDQELIVAGTVDYGNMLYAVNTTGTLPEASEFYADIPTGKLVGTYYVFYKSSGDSNHNEYAASSDNKVEVSIAQVDKTVLAGLISEVEDYLDTIEDDYPTIAATLGGHKGDIEDDYYDEPNVTATQVANAVNELNGYLDAAKVATAEAKIDAIGTLAYTPEKKALIDDAKDYYDNTLNDTQRELVDANKVAALTKANDDYNAVDEVVDQINEIGEPKDTDDFREKVAAARDAYNALTNDQKEIFPEDILKALTDEEAAIPVMDKINAIGDVEYTPESKALIDEANDAYAGLTDDQKALVANYPKLALANTDYDKVDEAVGKVNAIGDVEYTEASKAKIDEAKETYDALSDYEKEIFPAATLKALVDDEKAYEAMDKIQTMGTPKNNNAFRAKVKNARETLDALTEDQKALVTPSFVKDLEDAEAAINAMNKVNAIGKVQYTPASKALIDGARATYDALSDDQKALVTNYSTLLVAETTYARLKANHKAADAVIAKINAIGNVTYTDESKAKIDSVRAAYNALTSDQKTLVTNYSTLTSAEEAYAKLKTGNDTANDVIAKINAIGNVEYTDECNNRIVSARAAYDALTSDQKALVTNYSTLTAAEAAYASFNTVDAVIAKINAIGNVAYTDESKAKIDSARAAYNALASDHKALVNNYSTLTSAEDAYAKLKADNDAANDVIAKINAIGNVEYTDECNGRIVLARAAYDALTSDQKALVNNYSTLTSAEDAYAKLKKENVNLSITHEESKVTFAVKTGTGIPNTVHLEVDVKTTVSAEEGSVEYDAIKTKLEKNEKISRVYDVKLIQTVNGVKTEIQPSDIEEGMIITVSMELPDGISAENLRILHIHSNDDMEFVEDFKVEGNEISFEIDRLSEFVFITSNNGLSGGAIAAIIIAVIIICAGIVVWILLKKKKSTEDEK